MIRFYLDTNVNDMLYKSYNITHIPQNGDIVTLHSPHQYRVIDRIFNFDNDGAVQYDIIIKSIS